MDIPDMRVNSLRDLVMDAEWWKYTYRRPELVTAEYTLNGGGKLFFAANLVYSDSSTKPTGTVRFATVLPDDDPISDDIDTWSKTGLTATFHVLPFDMWEDDGYGDHFVPYTASTL